MKKNEPKIIKDLEIIEKKEESNIRKFIRGPRFRLILLFIVLAVIGIVIIYLVVQGGRVYTENAQIQAPIISLSPTQSGVLEQVYVKEGDIVTEGMTVAKVAGVPIKAKAYGVIVGITNTPGAIVTPQTSVVQMIDPTELRVVGRVEEDKGLSKIKPGQKVVFTVDAFGSKNYNGVVESIAETSHQSDIVFSISDKRELQDFDIKVKYDINDYPELKNGMSAKMWIYQ